MKIITSKKKCDSCCATTFDDICATIFDDIVHPGSALYLCGAQSLFYDAQYLTSTAFDSVYTAFVSIIPHNGVDIDCDSDRDPVHYGVVYEYVYANDVLFYNIQGFNPFGNNKCNNLNRYNGDYNDVVCNNSP